MTPEEILANINTQMEGLKARLDTLVTEKATMPITEIKTKMDEYETKYAQLEESLKALQKPANVEPLGAVDDRGDPACGYKNLGEVFNDEILKKTQHTVTPNYEKLLKISTERKTAGTGLLAGSAQYGGALIPEQFRTQIWERVGNITQLLNKVTILPISGGNSLTIPALGGYDESSGQYYGGVYFTDIGENTTISDVRPKFENMTWTLKGQAAMTHVSDNMLTFSPMSIGPFVERVMTSALANRIEDLLLNGTGEAHPIGAVTAPCGISVSAESNQTAATVNYYNIIKMKPRISNEAVATWMMNPNVQPQLDQLAVLIGLGGQKIDVNEALGGMPRIKTHFCRTVGTIGDIMLIDWSENVVLVPQGQSANGKMDTSIHFHFDTAQTSFRFIFYWDAQFAWRTAKTPRYGDTISPVVRLATR